MSGQGELKFNSKMSIFRPSEIEMRYFGEMVEARQKSENELLQRIQKNGITIEELNNRYKTGKDEGFKLGSRVTIESFYAALALALKRELGFGQERMLRVMNTTDDIMRDALCKMELLDLANTETGLEFKFDEPFDRIRPKSKKKGA